MKVRMLSRLNLKQKEEIRVLEKLCQEADKTKTEVYLNNDCNIKISVPNFYLCYEEEELICFLVLYFPEVGYAEAVFILHPEKRGGGYFSSVFLKAREKLLNNGITRLCFVYESANKAVIPFLTALGARKESSEYLLCYERKEGEDFSLMPGLLLKKAAMEDVDEIVKLHLTLFKMKETYAVLLIKGCITGKRMILYQLLKDEILAGFCCVAMEGECCTIFSLAVAKAYQGMGFGKQMLYLLMERLDGVKRVLLHVSSTNEAAFHLYKNFGFQTEEQFDYYALNL